MCIVIDIVSKCILILGSRQRGKQQQEAFIHKAFRSFTHQKPTGRRNCELNGNYTKIMQLTNLFSSFFLLVYFTEKCIPSSTTTRLETATQNVGSDVVLVVDQSNSMGNEIQWLKDIIPQLDAELLKNQVGTDPSCPNRYAVVGFGRAIPGHLATLYTPRVGGEMFPIGQYNDAVRNLVEDGAGRFEDGFQAMDFALRTLPLRTSTSQCQISKNMILLTDEDRDVADGYEGLTRPVMQDRLARANFKLNAIVDNAFTVGGVRGIGRISNRGFGSPSFGSGTCYTSSSSVSSQNGYGNTKAMYTDMALALGGGAWDILQLRDPSIRSAMTCAMLDVKVTEIASEVTRCYICSCSQFSQRTCRLSTASEEPECLCMNNNRQVSFAKQHVLFVHACACMRVCVHACLCVVVDNLGLAVRCKSCSGLNQRGLRI